jgi:hypothetical protein
LYLPYHPNPIGFILARFNLRVAFLSISIMNRFATVALTWLALAGTLAVNALANILPINGLNTGQVSGFYPNLFVPDGFTFSIWSVIYLGLLAFAGYTTRVVGWLPAEAVARQRVVAILPLFWLSCGFNAGWIVVWHYLQVGLSLVVMLALLATLLVIFLRLQQHRPGRFTASNLLADTPFVMYLAWICVATIANTTALLVHLGWQGGVIAPAGWSIGLQVVAFGLATAITLWYGRPAFSLVVAWALWGIYRAQSGPVAFVAASGAAVLLMMALAALARKTAHTAAESMVKQCARQ